MSGYLHFECTENDKIDAIVRILNRAGDAFHHTESWHDEMDYMGGKTYHELIQEALNNAAAPIDRMKHD